MHAYMHACIHIHQTGRIRLKENDVVGVVIDTGSHYGEGQVTFFVNGIQVCIFVHVTHVCTHTYVCMHVCMYMYVCICVCV